MNLDELLGIDLDDPIQQNANQLVDADQKLLDDLVALRRASMTQEEAAARMGVSQSAVARIESGERDPHLSTLRRYALAVGARIEHHVSIFSGTEREQTLRPDPTLAVGAAWARTRSQELVKEWELPGAELVDFSRR